MNWVWVVVIAIGGLLAYIRLAPSDVARWHVIGEVSGDKTFKSGVIRVVEAGPEGLERLHKIALAAPRTRVLAGSVSEGMVTYISRSKLFGFPDYTTVRQTETGLDIYARLRFGRSDTGVNSARIKRWLALGEF